MAPASDTPADPKGALPAPPARRSLVAFACIAAGFSLARELPAVPAAAWLGACAAALIVAALAARLPVKAALAAAAVLLGAGWFALRINETPRHHLSGLAAEVGPAEPHAPILITVEGMVVERPSIVDPANGAGALARFAAAGRERRWRTSLDVDRLIGPAGPVAASGRLRVWIPCREGEAPLAARPGDRIRISGELEPIEPPLNPGAPDRRLWAAQEGGGGGAGSLRVPSLDLIEPLEPRAGAAWRAESAWVRLLDRLRSGAQRALDAAVGEGRAPPESRAVLAALLLGEYDSAAQDVTSAFTRQGLVHLLAISGFHLVIIAGAACFLIRLTGERGRLESAAVAVLIVFYLLIIPAQTPVIRAGAMVLGFLAAEAAGRRYDRLTVLGWIAAGLILWRPMDLWSLGFQLSCGIVAVLLWLGRLWHNRLWGVPLRGTVPDGPSTLAGSIARAALGHLKALVSASILCWATAAPLVAHHTGIVSPLAALAGVLIVPLITVLLWLGYAALALGAVVPPAAAAVGWLLGRLSLAAADVVRWLDHIPGTVLWLPGISAAWAAAATTLAMYWFARGHARDRLAWGATAAVLAWLAAEVLLAPGLSWRGAARVDALAVGDGTCLLVRAGRGIDGEGAMLWDCGSLRTGLGVRELPRAVRALGAWKVRTAVVTHAHLDHFSALPDLVGPLGIRRVIISPAMANAAARDPGSAAAALLALLRTRGVEVRVAARGDTFALGDATVEFLWPDAAAAGLSLLRANEASLVARVSVATGAGERGMLLTGDIGPVAQGALLDDPAAISADVLELPHHGSVHDAALAFVAASRPGVVLQSTGPRRAGDPRWDPLRAGRRWLTTATDGASWAEIRRDGSIETGSLRTRNER